MKRAETAENSTETACRPRGRPFKPGQSGNPGGRPRVAAAVRDLLKRNSVAAAQCVIGLMASEDSRVALSAAREVLDRVLGKPSQTTEITGPNGGPLAFETEPKRDYCNLTGEETKLLDALLARLEGDFEPLESFRKLHGLGLPTLTVEQAKAARTEAEAWQQEVARRRRRTKEARTWETTAKK